MQALFCSIYPNREKLFFKDKCTIPQNSGAEVRWKEGHTSNVVVTPCLFALQISSFSILSMHKNDKSWDPCRTVNVDKFASTIFDGSRWSSSGENSLFPKIYWTYQCCLVINEWEWKYQYFLPISFLVHLLFTS